MNGDSTNASKIRDRIFLAIALAVAIGGIFFLFSQESAEAPTEEYRSGTQTEQANNPEPTTINYPAWIDELISEIESEPVTNPPASITEYQYEGETVYYFEPGCCDQFTELYDTDGTLICAPDGGITGEGDGRCTDFRETRTGGIPLWSDLRDENLYNNDSENELNLI